MNNIKNLSDFIKEKSYEIPISKVANCFIGKKFQAAIKLINNRNLDITILTSPEKYLETQFLLLENTIKVVREESIELNNKRLIENFVHAIKKIQVA